MEGLEGAKGASITGFVVPDVEYDLAPPVAPNATVDKYLLHLRVSMRPFRSIVTLVVNL